MDNRQAVLAYLYSKKRASLDDLVKNLEMDREEAIEVLNSLESEGLVKAGHKGLIFKRRVYELTPKGLEAASKIYSELRAKAEKLNEITGGGRQLSVDDTELKELGITPLEAMAMAVLGLLTAESITALGMLGLLEAEPFLAQIEEVPEEIEVSDEQGLGTDPGQQDADDSITDQDDSGGDWGDMD